MPTYQYACTACGHQLEAVQAFADEPLTECPACEGRLRKIFSAVGVVFKGSGFYRTDSRAAANGSKDGAKSEVKADSKTESKSGSKSGSKDSTPAKTDSSKSATSSSSSAKPAPAAA